MKKNWKHNLKKTKNKKHEKNSKQTLHNSGAPNQFQRARIT